MKINEKDEREMFQNKNGVKTCMPAEIVMDKIIEKQTKNQTQFCYNDSLKMEDFD
ncbi:bystin [Culex quinquefasciatus]|uniref:Bystin n=1 Tax=Culex quinquefasciatus TaxID=7176 RepID=B0W313_CULQU|nr:bystin [Culex quinquefasciatus]|eukprot:XP_001843097.1 bystin [Culex quinquefasciatus]